MCFDFTSMKNCVTSCLHLFLLALFFSACGNTEEPLYRAPEKTGGGYTSEEIACMGSGCEKHSDCDCGADLCIHPMAGMMDPEIDEESGVNICTIRNCNPEYHESCPDGWHCYKIPMGNQLLDNAETMCIKDL